MTAALTVENLVKSYRRRKHTIEVLKGIDLQVDTGEWVALTGPSGCGKTTLLHVLGVLDKPTSGRILYFDKNTTGMGSLRQAKLRRTQIGFVFQSSQLFPELTALENVMLAGRLNRQSDTACRAAALALIEQMGVAHRLQHRPAELSGGEQQRLAIARALINKPRIILADEPTGNLDASNAGEIIRLLEELREREKLTVVMVTHDRDLARRADRTMIMQDGKLRRL